MKLFRPKYTKIIDGKPVQKQLSKWYAKVKIDGKWKPVPLSTNKRAAEIMLADMLRQNELGKVGAVDPFAAAGRVLLTQHVADYAAELSKKGRGRHVAESQRFLTRCFAEIDADYLQEVTHGKLTAFILSQKVGHRRRSWYCTVMKTFFRWVVRSRRIGESPAENLEPGDTGRSRVYVRRPLTRDEVVRLVAAADASKRSFRGLTGTDRGTLYTLAVATGYRVSELASLTRQSIALGGQTPTANLAAEHTKNRKAASQPLPAWCVERLREMPERAEALFPGTWHEKAAKMLRADLDAAGILSRSETPTGPRVVDFHSLRGTYIRLLRDSGVELGDAMRLARHSDPKLTLAVYGESDFTALGDAVNKIGMPHNHGHYHAADTIQDDTGQFNTIPGCELGFGPALQTPRIVVKSAKVAVICGSEVGGDRTHDPQIKSTLPSLKIARFVGENEEPDSALPPALPSDRELREIVEAWPRLSEHARVQMLGIVRSQTRRAA